MKPYPPYDNISPRLADEMGRVLCSIGHITDGQHSEMTPYRLIHYLRYWNRLPDNIRFTTFANENPVIDNIATVGPITFWAACSHHLLPFMGRVYFGYIPKDTVVGLSMVTSFIRSFCARPWLQETMTSGLADAFEERLKPFALGIITTARHTCQMLDLGPDVPVMTVSEMRGAFRINDAARNEFEWLSGYRGGQQ